MACGLYSSTVKLLKLANGVISVHLATIFKQSICSVIFPSKLKRAKIIPIFKDEGDSLPENYRPISLLSIYNKIFEKLMYPRLTKFVKIATFFMIRNTVFAVSTVLSMLYLILLKCR